MSTFIRDNRKSHHPNPAKQTGKEKKNNRKAKKKGTIKKKLMYVFLIKFLYDSIKKYIYMNDQQNK